MQNVDYSLLGHHVYYIKKSFNDYFLTIAI